MTHILYKYEVYLTICIYFHFRVKWNFQMRLRKMESILFYVYARALHLQNESRSGEADGHDMEFIFQTIIILK